jgi:hypothetical protein
MMQASCITSIFPQQQLLTLISPTTPQLFHHTAFPVMFGCCMPALAGTPLPFPLTDQRPLPADLLQLAPQEGASMHWHFRNLQNFAHWSSCISSNNSITVTRGYVSTANPSEAWLKPVGWQVVSTLWLQSSNSRDVDVAQFSSPFAAVLVKEALLVVLVRGSKTLTDWLAGKRQQQHRQQQQQPLQHAQGAVCLMH